MTRNETEKKQEMKSTLWVKRKTINLSISPVSQYFMLRQQKRTQNSNIHSAKLDVYAEKQSASLKQQLPINIVFLMCRTFIWEILEVNKEV